MNNATILVVLFLVSLLLFGCIGGNIPSNKTETNTTGLNKTNNTVLNATNSATIEEYNVEENLSDIDEAIDEIDVSNISDFDIDVSDVSEVDIR